MVFAADDEAESHLWVMALYRATGQLHKPTPPLTPASGKSSTMAKIQGDTDRARKHGMDEYISADPVKFEHAHIFKQLQTLTLDFRLNDPFCSLVPFPFTQFKHSTIYIATRNIASEKNNHSSFIVL